MRALDSRLGPYDRVINPAAEELLTLLVTDAVDDLVLACRDPEIREAMTRLLETLVLATGKKPFATMAAKNGRAP